MMKLTERSWLSKIYGFFFKSAPPVSKPLPYRKSAELLLLETQIENSSQQHAQWAEKWYLQLVLDGLPEASAAKQTSFKFFGSYQNN